MSRYHQGKGAMPWPHAIEDVATARSVRHAYAVLYPPLRAVATLSTCSPRRLIISGLLRRRVLRLPLSM